MIGSDLEKYTFEYLMSQALANVPDTIDKRQGSIIYDALAPACYRLAELYMNLRDVYRDTYALYAEGEALDLRVADIGFIRRPATPAVKRADFQTSNGSPASVPLGSRFSSISDTNPMNYVVIGPYEENGIAVPGAYRLQCETAGTIGNEYYGDLNAITFVPNVSKAIMSELLVPGTDEETDEQLRARYFEKLQEHPFGGNIADYRATLKAINGVGDVQIYPVWNGGGTVKISVIDSEYNPVSQNFLDTLQDMIDPSSEGKGLGLAPIGHKVTITTATLVELNISANIVLSPGYIFEQVRETVVSALREYVLDLKKTWGIGSEMNEYSISIYIAKITSVILSVPGVANVTSVTVNGSNTDIELIESAEVQELPELGEVILNV